MRADILGIWGIHAMLLQAFGGTWGVEQPERGARCEWPETRGAGPAERRPLKCGAYLVPPAAL